MHMSQSYIMHNKKEVHRDMNRLAIILHHLASSSVTCDFTQYPEFGMSCSFILPETENLFHQNEYLH